MRILHLGKFFPPVPGGIERALAGMAEAGVAAGEQVAVLAHAPPGVWRSRRHATATLPVWEAGCLGQLVYAPLSPQYPLLLTRLLRDFRPDLLHLHLPNTSAFFALLSPAARRLPWVVHWHADIPLDSGSPALRLAYPLYRPWEQAVLRRARAIIATSESYLQASSALLPWRDKVCVIPLSLAPSPAAGPAANGASPAATWLGDGLRLLAVGRLSHYKGYDVLLQAMTELPQVSLLLIGSGEEEAHLRARVAALGLGGRVRLAGHVGDAELQRAYAAAEAFCLPSLDRAEAFGLVLLEAMRAALPVVASDIPGSGVGHVARAGETALLVPPGDHAALAAALRDLAADAPLRERLGRAGQVRWRAEFTPAQTTATLLQLYRRVLASPA
ncbi:MAG: glycosyltransferase [Lysobacterales bacterium]